MNNPEFLGNAETRRRYVAQISHLRHLGGKGKCLQTLTMAVGSSGISRAAGSSITPKAAKSNKSPFDKCEYR